MPKKIKILHILPSLSRGGAEKICRELLLKIDSEKFSSALLLFKDIDFDQAGREELIANNIEIISLRKRCLIDPINFWQILKTIKRVKPDIIHTHLGGDIYGRLAGKLAGAPIIVSTEHNLNNNERRLAAIGKKITARYAAKIFAVSEAVKNDAVKRYNIPPEKIAVIYNGVDALYFRPDYLRKNNEKNGEEKKIIIGALGRLTAQKGFETLIEAATKIKNKDYLIKIAGIGESENKLKDKIIELNLDKRVNLVGAVNARDFLADIDIFVFPSLWEGLGLAVLEAGSMAKPIIASETGGIKEIINDNNGWLFPAGDATELAGRIDFVITNLKTEGVREKTEKIKKIVDSQFSLDTMIEAYEEWYQILQLKNKVGK